jgi:ferredoxin
MAIPPDPGQATTDPTATAEVRAEVTILLDRKKVTATHAPGEVLLETARRAGLTPPFSCEAGNCGTCMALLVDGHATMRVNDALTDEEVEEGYVLTCQAEPDTATVTVDYEA